MDVQQKSPTILIYYNFRGQAQAIRSLFCYLELPLVEVHLQNFQQQRKTLPKEVLSTLRNVKIDKSLLPILIDGELMIYDVYPIMAYGCYQTQREELLGKNMEKKVRLQEFMEVYTVRQPQSMVEFFRFADYVIKHADDEIRCEERRSYRELMRNSMYLKELCDYVTQQSPEGYVFGDLTILDFLFLESCIYMLGGFDRVDGVEHETKLHKRRRKSSCDSSVEPELLLCLRVMRNFLARITAEPFYIRNKKYLESFSILSPLVPPQRIAGVKKFWLGDPKLIAMSNNI